MLSLSPENPCGFLISYPLFSNFPGAGYCTLHYCADKVMVRLQHLRAIHQSVGFLSSQNSQETDNHNYSGRKCVYLSQSDCIRICFVFIFMYSPVFVSIKGLSSESKLVCTQPFCGRHYYRCLYTSGFCGSLIRRIWL